MGRVGVVGGLVSGCLVVLLALAPSAARATGLVAAENVPLNLRASAAATASASMPAALPEDEAADDSPTLIDGWTAPVVVGMAPASPRLPGRPGSNTAGALGEPDGYALVVIGLLAVGAALLRHSRNRQAGPRRVRR